MNFKIQRRYMMEKIEEFGEILKEIKRVQSLALDKYNGYDNMPEDTQAKFDEINKKLLEMMKEL